MSVTAPPQKRRVNIVGGEQIQSGAITADKIESDLLSRLESVTLKAKINYLDFTTPNDGEIYLHGYVDGQEQDVNGYVIYGGLRYNIPKGPVGTHVDQEGYLVFSTATDFVARGLNLLPSQTVVAAYVSDGQWYYDANDGLSHAFVPNPATDIVIGYYKTGGVDLVEQAYVFKDPVPINEVVITSRKILANAILSEHITAGEIITAHMQANSIEGDRIKANSLDAEKITTSTLYADLTLSGSIMTSSAGARVEMDNLGLRAYNTGGTETVNIDASDGSVTIVGGIQSGGEIQGAILTGGVIQTNPTPTVDGIIIDDTNGLRAYEAGLLNTHINRLGIADFRKVSIEGLPADVTFSVGSGSSIFRLDSAGLYLGSNTFATAPFRVGYDGRAILTSATLTGVGLVANEKIIDTTAFSVDKEGDVVASSITVNNGTMAGGTIDIGGADTTSFHVDSSGQMWMGAGLYAAAPFRVSNTGALDIGGVDGTSFHVDNTGNLWIGDGIAGNAPFRVTNTGALLASNVTITDDNATGDIITTANFTVSSTGTVSATSGVFNSGTINGTFSVTGDLNVNGGSINLASGDLNVGGTGNINVSNGQVIVSADGALRSANYDAGTQTGWYLGPTGLDLNGLSIDAGSLQIGISNTNLFKNSSFEGGITVATGWNGFAGGGAAADFTVSDANFLYQSKAQRIEVTSTGDNVGIYQDVIVNEPIEINEVITVSYWVNQTVGSAKPGKVWFHSYGSDIDVLRNSYSEILTVGSWVRVVDSYTTTQQIVGGLRIYILFGDVINGDIFYIDGAQIQRSSYPTDFQPAALEIPENYINSTHIASLSADKLSSGIVSAQTIQIGDEGYIQSFNWNGTGSGYRLSSEGATFQNGSVTIVGAGGAVVMSPTEFRATYNGQNTLVADANGLKLAGSIDITPTAMQSSNYTSTDGWQITSAGNAIFNSITARNTIFLGNNRISAGGGSSSDYLASSNFQTGVSGWVIRGNGDVEFRNGTFRGHIIGTSGTFTGTIDGANIIGGTITGGTITGTVYKSSASGQRLELSGTRLYFYGGGGVSAGYIHGGMVQGYGQSGIEIAANVSVFGLETPSIQTWSVQAPNNLTITAGGSITMSKYTTFSTTAQFNGQISVSGGATFYSSLYVGSGFDAHGTSNVHGSFFANGSTVRFTNLPVTSAASSAHLTSLGTLYRSTSSKKYKKNVKSAADPKLQDMANRLLTLDPVSFLADTDIEPGDPDNLFGKEYLGFIAESVHEVMGPYASYFVDYNEYDEPEALFYDRMWIPLLYILKQIKLKDAK